MPTSAYPYPTDRDRPPPPPSLQILPGVLAVFAPVAIGFILGPKGTAGLLAGALGESVRLRVRYDRSGRAYRLPQ